MSTTREVAGAEGSAAVTRAGPSTGSKPGSSTAAAIKVVSEDTRALIRAEIALAKAELTNGLKAKGMGAGLLVGAGVVGWLGLQGVLITLGFLLALVLPGWAAALIVTAVLLVVAAVLGLLGKSRLSTPVSLDTTKRNVEEDVTWAKTQLPRA